jgi:hypothetical protein
MTRGRFFFAPHSQTKNPAIADRVGCARPGTAGDERQHRDRQLGPHLINSSLAETQNARQFIPGRGVSNRHDELNHHAIVTA